MMRTGQSQISFGGKLINIQDGRLVMKRKSPKIESLSSQPLSSQPLSSQPLSSQSLSSQSLSSQSLSSQHLSSQSLPSQPLSSQQVESAIAELDELTDSLELQCCVCMQNKKVIAGGRCGHCLCMSCSRRITETTENDRRCPQCRKPWLDLLRIY